MFSCGRMLRVMYTGVMTAVVSSFVELNNDIVVTETVDIVKLY